MSLGALFAERRKKISHERELEIWNHLQSIFIPNADAVPRCESESEYLKNSRDPESGKISIKDLRLALLSGCGRPAMTKVSAASRRALIGLCHRNRVVGERGSPAARAIISRLRSTAKSLRGGESGRKRGLLPPPNIIRTRKSSVSWSVRLVGWSCHFPESPDRNVVRGSSKRIWPRLPIEFLRFGATQLWTAASRNGPVPPASFCPIRRVGA